MDWLPPEFGVNVRKQPYRMKANAARIILWVLIAVSLWVMVMALRVGF